MDPLSLVASILGLVDTVLRTSKLVNTAVKLLGQTGDGFSELERQVVKCQLTLDLFRGTIEQLNCGAPKEVQNLAPKLRELVTSIDSLLFKVEEDVDEYGPRRPLKTLGRPGQIVHYLGDKPKRWAEELEIRNAELHTALSLIQQNIATIRTDPVPKPDSYSRRESNPPSSPEHTVPIHVSTHSPTHIAPVRVLDANGSGKWISVHVAVLDTPPCPVNMFIGRDLLRKLGLGTEYKEQEDCVKSSRGGAKDRSKTMDDDAFLTPMSMMRLGKNILTHSPLILASVGAIYMGKWRPDPPAYEMFILIANTDDTASVLDTFPTTEYPKLFAAIAATTFSLTLHHYILVQQSKDRDLLVFAFVGLGVVAGVLAGLDGISNLLRIAPWCAIAAFFLCAFILPPRNRNINISETQDRGEPKKVGFETETSLAEKEQTTNAGASADSKIMAGLDMKMDTGDVQYMV